MVEAVLAEHGHHAGVFHAAVFHYEVEEQAAHGRGLVDGLETMAAHHVGYGEQRTAVEPARYVVVARVVEERVGRYVEDGALHVLEVVDAHYLLARGRIADYEVAEAEIGHYGVAEVDRQFL